RAVPPASATRPRTRARRQGRRSAALQPGRRSFAASWGVTQAAGSVIEAARARPTRGMGTPADAPHAMAAHTEHLARATVAARAGRRVAAGSAAMLVLAGPCPHPARRVRIAGVGSQRSNPPVQVTGATERLAVTRTAEPSLGA